jgi:hypothetical protein
MTPNESTPPGYNTPIPSKIMTPDSVDSRLGSFEFHDGLPTAETATRLFDNLDFLRGVEVFLQCVPPASIEGLRSGLVGFGCDAANKLVITDRMMDSDMLFLTGNTDTVYVIGIFDLDRDGPTVVEVPPGCGPGTVDDAWFRFVTDMGAPGPDRGAGGSYLIVPEGYDGEAPEGYFVAETPSSTNLLALRGFLVDGKPDAAAAMFTEGVKVYPLSQAADPPAMEFISGSGHSFNTIHANDFSFYEELADVVRREPLGVIDPETRGLLASIGITKDAPFDPNRRLRETLTEAAAVGNATARAICFQTRDETAFTFEGRQWKTAFIGEDYKWLGGDGAEGRGLDARLLFFYQATLNTPAMALKMVGVGSQYAFANLDADGELLSGDATYRLTLPPDIPAKDFWSVVIYDPQTRSELQTGQPLPGRNNERDDLAFNEDGSVDILFGPTAPEQNEDNWIQTVPGKGWYALLRLYGPLEPWFEKTWVPGDIERV